MIFRKAQPSLPAPKNNSVWVKFGPMIEIKADGWGLVVAPLLALIIVVVVVFGASVGGSAMVNGIGNIVRVAQSTPEADEKPPPIVG